jgi:hypothetical protein
MATWLHVSTKVNRSLQIHPVYGMVLTCLFKKLKLKGVIGDTLPNFHITSDRAMFRASLILPVKVHAFSNGIPLLRAGQALSKRTKLRGNFKAVSMFYHKV